METVFITIHDLSLDARIKYASDSVEDILGYQPHEVKGKSCWEYFHPDEIPFARAIHGRGISLDKAASLNYCQIKHKDGSWVGCECVFTVVYDVIVASTAIYRRGPRSLQRAIDGAGIRRLFSSTPRDPRYHMLSFISNKFYKEPQPYAHEPRAALFLNRFTRTSTIMFATNSVANILGMRPEQLVGKSFYFCISENCLQDAVRCVESAKHNDSIAYLRFHYREPLQQNGQGAREASLLDAQTSDEDDDEGGVPITNGQAPAEQPLQTPKVGPIEALAPLREGSTQQQPSVPHNGECLRTSSGDSTDVDIDAADAIFDPPAIDRSESSVTPAEDHDETDIEIEAVISCSSDGLVVVLRRAHPLIPHALGAAAPYHANGLFASPWATNPVLPENAPAAIPPELGATSAAAETEPVSFMRAIREVAVFAWSLTGINGALSQYARGMPVGEALPPGGLPVWDPKSNADPENKFNGFMGGSHRPIEEKVQVELSDGKPGVEDTSSDDEVLWKRVPTIPSWRPAARRGRDEAFGDGDGDYEEREEEERAQVRKKARGDGAGTRAEQ